MFANLFLAPPLTPARIRCAYITAAVGDALQLALMQFGWAGPDQAIDVILMIVQWRLLGFHPLLLPTFILELFPMVDMLPTWFGCTALVITLRKNKQTAAASPAPPPTIEPPVEPPRLLNG